MRELAIVARYFRRLARQISRGEITPEDLQNELDDFSQQPEQWHQLQESALDIREDFHQELGNFLNSMEDDTTEPEPDTLNLFAVTVWIPCMCLCGRSPDKLFQEASAGDFESLCTLIRLDRTAQYIPEISQHIAEWERLRHKHRMRLMALEEARRGYVDQYKNAEHIKLAVIQRLLNYVQSIEQLKLFKVKHFTKNDLRHLFDALSRDRKGTTIDEDFPFSDEAFIKAVKRGSVSRMAEEGWDIFLS